MVKISRLGSAVTPVHHDCFRRISYIPDARGRERRLTRMRSMEANGRSVFDISGNVKFLSIFNYSEAISNGEGIRPRLE